MSRSQAFELISNLIQVAFALDMVDPGTEEYRVIDAQYMALRGQAADAMAGPPESPATMAMAARVQVMGGAQ